MIGLLIQDNAYEQDIRRTSDVFLSGRNICP